MKCWYSTYWAQTWYENTFLVQTPEQIACTVGNRAWNNMYDSGCHFTCLAMIVGIDPARLASELRGTRYFAEDKSLPAILLNGATKPEGLVWDQNAPHEKLRSIKIKKLWHHGFGRRVSIALSYLGKTSTNSYDSASSRIFDVRSRGNHVVCGPDEHSYLVAGEADGEYFLWDPDGSQTSVERNLQGRINLKSQFRTYKRKKFEFWEYSFDAA